ncbi:MAG: energy-dependent translational throttle protein EttA [Deltaproteobacteria bacterium]|nr:energy-dependent translational throttle protein EttA [Deltaproteobacteria bacterium]
MSTNQVICTMQGVGRVHPPKKQVLKDIYLSYFYGAKIGVLGLNGSGKSSLLRIMSGVDQDYLGTMSYAKGYTVGFLEQEPLVDRNKTVRECVEEGVQPIIDMKRQFEEISSKFTEDMDPDAMEKLINEQAELQEKLEHAGAWDLDSRLDMAMDALRCPPADTKIETLSGGEKRRVALCRLLLKEPDVLLLDEPTNHLDAESVEWLEKHLKRYKGTVIAVTHDRYFLDNAAGWILELDRGEGIPWEGNYSSWLEQKSKRLEVEQKQQSRLQKTLARELEWVRSSPKARQAKSKARMAAYDSLLAQQADKRDEELEIYIPPGPRLGDLVIEAKGVSKAFGDRLLFENMNFNLPKGAVMGVIGPNGAGKSTLFKILMGREKPDGGTITIGSTVRLGYVDQDRDALDPKKTIWEAVSGGEETLYLGNRQVNSRAYVARFNFQGPDQQKTVGVLSGGERNRVHLAKMLMTGSNVLLLDEPTNDLDVNTIRALEEAIGNFAGSAIVVSHDRWFLDRVATHILAFEGDSSVVFFDGNYTQYEEDKRRRLGAEADRPHRIKYKPLKR